MSPEPGQSNGFGDQTVVALIDAVASDEPTSGGGTVASVAAALAAALASMAARYALRRQPQSTRSQELLQRTEHARRRALRLGDLDRVAYGRYVDALTIPREPDPEDRKLALRVALNDAAEVPHELASLAAEVASIALELAETGNPNVRSDAYAAAVLSAAAATSAAILVRENLRQEPGDDRVVAATQNAVAAVKLARSALEMSGLEIPEGLLS